MTGSVFIASVFQETNVFSPLPTTLAGFDQRWRPAAGATEPPADLDLLGYGGALRRARAAGVRTVLSLFASATPAAPMRAADWARLRDEIVGDLRRAGPVGMVFLFLHGAQAAQDEPDCAGDLLTAVRAVVGEDTPIGVELDLHANLTERMLAGATIITACKEYPHTDFAEVGAATFDLLLRTARGEVRPAMRAMRVPLVAIAPTTDGAVRDFTERLRATERVPGVLAASALYGFFGADGPDTGGAVIVVSDADPRSAELHATTLAGAQVEAVRATGRIGVDVEGALAAAARAAPDRAIIADRADNPGGGAAGDSTFLLRALLGRNVRDAALGVIWDPVAVDLAHAAGVGSVVPLRIGGKVGPLSGPPLDVLATVTAVRDDVRQARFGVGPATLPLGRSAALQVDGVTVVIASERAQVFDRSVFTAHDIDLEAMWLIVVKSTQHFHGQFAGLGQVIYCDAPGTVTTDLASLPYRRLRRPLYPLDDGPIVPVPMGDWSRAA